MSRPLPFQVRWWKPLVALTLSVAGLMLAFRRVPLFELAPVLGSVRWGWLVAAVVCFGVACFASASRWHLALQLSGQAVHPRATLRCFLIGHFWNVALFGAAGGDLARSACYARWHRLPFPEVAASAPIERTIGFAGALLFALGAVLLSASRGRLPAFEQWPFKSTGILLFAAVTAIATLLAAGLVWLALQRGPESRLRRFVSTLVSGLRQLGSQPGLAVSGLMWGMLTQGAIACVTAASLEAVGVREFIWVDMLWTLSVISLLTLVPSVAGLGVRENAALAMLGLYQLPPERIVSATLLCVVPQLIWAGLGAWLFVREERAHQRQENREPSAPRNVH